MTFHRVKEAHLESNSSRMLPVRLNNPVVTVVAGKAFRASNHLRSIAAFLQSSLIAARKTFRSVELSYVPLVTSFKDDMPYASSCKNRILQGPTISQDLIDRRLLEQTRPPKECGFWKRPTATRTS